MSEPLNVYAAMAQVTRSLSHIPKSRSSGVNYEFRSIDALMNALHQPLADNGLFLAPRVLDDWRAEMIAGTNNRQQTQVLFRVEVEVYAADGTSVVIGPGLAQSHDYGDKAAYQAQQNAIKYLLLEAFCIPVDEPDMDARHPDPVESVSVVDFVDRCDPHGVKDVKGLLATFDGDLQRAMKATAGWSDDTWARAAEKFGGES